MPRRSTLLVFHVDLLQDVAVIRPLVRLAARSIGSRDRLILVTSAFAGRDRDGMWWAELSEVAAETETPIQVYDSPFDAWLMLKDSRGTVIAGSESSLENHALTHSLFRALPSTFRTVALQHGFECVGFLHNAAHSRAVGDGLRFAADTIVGWFDAPRLSAVPMADRPKLMVAGPPMMIDVPRPSQPVRGIRGLDVPSIICENLHSVRFGTEARGGFAEIFASFMARAESIGEKVNLRPHPAGRFTEKSKTTSSRYLSLDVRPLHKLRLDEVAYAISAPSTILLDFLLADVPVAVWQDASGSMDTRNFAGLTQVTDVDEWWQFAARSRADRGWAIGQQRRFVENLGIPQDVEGRYVELMTAFG